MPHVSRYKLNPSQEKELIESLNLVLSSISNKHDMLRFINSLLTDTEKLMLAKRLGVVVLVKEGLQDSDISSALHITRMTISKLRYYYEARAKEGYDIALRKIEGEKVLQGVKRFLLALADYSARAAGGYVRPTVLHPRLLKDK